MRTAIFWGFLFLSSYINPSHIVSSAAGFVICIASVIFFMMDAIEFHKIVTRK